MDMPRSLSISMLGLFLVTIGARADPSSSAPAYDLNTQVDPDGVPYAVTQAHQAQPSQADIEAARKQREEAATNKNWLVNSYERQLQSHHQAGSSNDQSSNLYFQLSSNKELAKLAGLPLIGSASAARAPHYRTGASPSAV